MADALHSIKMVVRKTGLSAHVIRIWEKRYGAVEPARTDTNRRLYSEDQIERLALLRDLTRAGHSIGQVAKLPTERLRGLLAEESKEAGRTEIAPAGTSVSGSWMEQCILAVKALDSRALEETLNRATTQLGSQGLLQQIVAPLVQTIGDLWREGVITAAHEHFASAVMRVFLGYAAKSFGGEEHAPILVVATPVGQLHELGALLAAAAAANLGWQVSYLGVSLPAAEIAGAVRQTRARAVALSLVYPEDDPRLEGELTRLRELLPPEVMLLVGGRAMPAYRNLMEKIGARQMKDLAELCSALDELRRLATQRGGA